MADDELSVWLERLMGGDTSAARVLWERCCESLARAARRKLPATIRRVTDEEDVALSAFNSFLGGVAAGRFPSLEHRGDLWALLGTIASRKIMARFKQHCALKRGGGRVVGESALGLPDDSQGVGGIGRVAGAEIPPDVQVQSLEEMELLLDRLEDESQRQIALCLLAGHTQEETARLVDVSLRTVKQRLQRIREIWEKEMES